jgi:hypothetical protein
MIIFHVSRDPSWSKAVHEIEDLGILVLVQWMLQNFLEVELLLTNQYILEYKIIMKV